MAKVEFEALIQRRSIDENQLPVRLRKKIADFRKVMAGLADIDTEMAQQDIRPDRKAELEQLREQSQAAIPDMDEELTQALDKWHKEKDKRLAAAKRTKAFNDKKKGQQSPEPEPGPAPAPAPPAEPAPQPAPEPQPSPSPAPAEPAAEKKRKISAGAWILIGLVGALTVGVGGVALAKHFAQRNSGA